MRPGTVLQKGTMNNNAFREITDKPLAKLPGASERVRLRNLFQVTQATLAERLGVSRRTIHAWESGKSEPTGDNREKYASMLALWTERERDA
jgi:DNA-binding transcriptional regulator YiaG